MAPQKDTPNDDDDFSTAGLSTNFLFYKLMEHISHKGEAPWRPLMGSDLSCHMSDLKQLGKE